MQQITQPLTPVTWYGPSLVLANAPWKSSVSVVRLINAAGTGYASFDPAQSFNSLTQVVAGQVLTINALPAAYAASGFTIDNGIGTTSTTDTSVFVAPAAASTKFQVLVSSRFQFGPPAFTVGAGSVSIQLGAAGAFQTYDLFNAALATLTDAQIQSATTPFTVLLTQANSAAATVEMAII